MEISQSSVEKVQIYENCKQWKLIAYYSYFVLTFPSREFLTERQVEKFESVRMKQRDAQMLPQVLKYF